ncbi:MAG: tRNA 4-thiouridine(8) synthase ThiI [Defluviitaleaceae bacterium]|nr:tRNA 4-thiouridine(8) synthase ThiI [Defluviitaleaceae bacterium]
MKKNFCECEIAKGAAKNAKKFREGEIAEGATKKVLLVKYGEISLRKGNRAHFEHALLDTIRAKLCDFSGVRVSREQGRFLVENIDGDLDISAVLPRIKNIFGIAGFCFAIKTNERDLEKLKIIGRDFFLAHIEKNFSRDEKNRDEKNRDENFSFSCDEKNRGENFSFSCDEKNRDEKNRDENFSFSCDEKNRGEKFRDENFSFSCDEKNRDEKNRGEYFSFSSDEKFRDEKNHNPQKITFRVETKRSDKNFPGTSTEISSAIGEAIFLAQNNSLAVDLHNPKVTLWVEIRNDVYFYVDGARGEGGLPYGSSGKGILLLSGGFDSPVAGFLTARRGVEIIAAYFHSPPFTSERAAEKARDLAKQLSRYTGRIKLHEIPFTEVQIFLKEKVADVKLTIFLKRAMLHIASRLAAREKALCLITGDSVGQVASQTIHSLAAVESAASLPILRPLAAFDKQEIIDLSQKIGTYEISVRPYEDCCTIFVAKHPENKPVAPIIENLEARFFDELSKKFDDAISATQTTIFTI